MSLTFSPFTAFTAAPVAIDLGTRRGVGMKNSNIRINKINIVIIMFNQWGVCAVQSILSHSGNNED